MSHKEKNNKREIGIRVSNHTFHMIFIENHLLSRVFIIAIHRERLVYPLLKDITSCMHICSMITE